MVYNPSQSNPDVLLLFYELQRYSLKRAEAFWRDMWFPTSQLFSMTAIIPQMGQDIQAESV